MGGILQIGVRQIMNVNLRRLNEEPYVGNLLVRFREGRGRQLPRLLDNGFHESSVCLDYNDFVL